MQSRKYFVGLLAAVVIAACQAAPPATPEAPPPTDAPGTTPVATPVATAAATAEPTPNTGEVFEWDLYTVYGPIPGSYTLQWQEELIPELERITGGRLKVTMFTAGEHPYTIFDSVQIMQDLQPELVQLGYAQSSGQDARFAVTDLPYLYPAEVAVYHQILDEFVIPEYFTPMLSESYGYYPLVNTSWPPQRVAGIDFFMDGMESLNGKRIRIWNPQLGDLIELLGGTPVSMAGGEVYTAMQTGLLDGTITSGDGMYLGGIFELANSMTMAEIQFGAISIVVSESALAALPDDLRQIVVDWARTTELRERDRYHGWSAGITLQGTGEFGVGVHTPDEEFVSELRNRAWEAIWQPWIESSGGTGSDAADAFNTVAKALIEAGYEVPNYDPY